jgi:rod shape-determining protein MreD
MSPRPMQRTISSVPISLLLIVVQTTLCKFLAIGTVVPDVLMLWIVYLALRDGQVAGTTAGFCIGLTLDLISGSDGMLGLSALSSSVAGFIAGYFYNENKTFQLLGSYQYPLLAVLVTLVHNVVYFLIFLQGSGVGWWRTIVVYGFLASLYTAVFGLLPMFAIARKHRSGT